MDSSLDSRGLGQKPPGNGAMARAWNRRRYTPGHPSRSLMKRCTAHRLESARDCKHILIIVQDGTQGYGSSVRCSRTWDRRRVDARGMRQQAGDVADVRASKLVRIGKSPSGMLSRGTSLGHEFIKASCRARTFRSSRCATRTSPGACSPMTARAHCERFALRCSMTTAERAGSTSRG